MDFPEDNMEHFCTSSDLHVAIYSQNYEVVANCVKKNKKILDSFWRGCTPVSSALYLKRYDFLELLVKNDANCNLCTRNNRMEPPLYAACRLHDERALTILLNSRALDIDQKDFFGRSSLWAAAKYCTADVVALLLNRGAKLNKNNVNFHPINGALCQKWKRGSKIIKLLIQHGTFLDSVCQTSPLKYAVQHADRDVFCLLISAGCKVQNKDWISYDQLPAQWKEDQSFCDWIEFCKKNPPRLQNITIWTIRTILGTTQNYLQGCHVEKLGLPSPLISLILLTKFLN